MYVSVLPRGCYVCMIVSYVEGGMYVSVLPRGWYVCVSYVEGGMCVCVLPRGWYVRVCVFSLWRVVVCTYVPYLDDGMYMYVCFLCGGW